ncbi:flagellar hook protein FlgE [Photobacterium aphoticum]|uniref:Flagellar hook protein FlgE n=1 Tax=Photobacterium aphoticum TaxID=754436 RepID=A0A090QUJ9_9GAMM|nr:flagellar hook protein FlgE [Photobacterium aphoticum]
MGFNISLSGIGASQKDLNTTSNNIANSNTFGFKESRAEFGDVYSSSIFSNAKTTTGGGVQTSVVAQQFHEGRVCTPTTRWTCVFRAAASLLWRMTSCSRRTTA